jgi:hypothetical protein
MKYFQIEQLIESNINRKHVVKTPSNIGKGCLVTLVALSHPSKFKTYLTNQ